MNTYEIVEYAKKQDKYDSLKFIMTNENGKSFEGHFLDAYYEMITIPEIGGTFIFMKQLREAGNFTFTPLE